MTCCPGTSRERKLLGHHGAAGEQHRRRCEGTAPGATVQFFRLADWTGLKAWPNGQKEAALLSIVDRYLTDFR